jgi:hypothetical protein
MYPYHWLGELGTIESCTIQCPNETHALSLNRTEQLSQQTGLKPPLVVAASRKEGRLQQGVDDI